MRTSWRAGAAVLLAGLAVGCADRATEQTGNIREQECQALIQKRHQALADHHERCVQVFAKEPGFGGIRMPRPSHNSNYPMDLSLPAGAEVMASTPAGQPLPETLQPWHVEQVALIGLLFDREPQARLPATYFLGHRDLDDFEKAALGRLQNGEPMVVLDGPAEIRMVAPVRAEQQCLKCHRSDEASKKPAIKEGSMVGAFTYVIKPGPFKKPEPVQGQIPVVPGPTPAVPLP